MNNKGWYGVDLDGTLAHYDEFVSPSHIGEPIPEMVNRVKRWIAEGKTIKIFTARVSLPDQMQGAIVAIQDWCRKHIGQVLEITCFKDYGMIELYDDRCVQVEHNTGILASEIYNRMGFQSGYAKGYNNGRQTRRLDESIFSSKI